MDHKSNLFVGCIVAIFIAIQRLSHYYFTVHSFFYYSITFNKDCELAFKDQVNYYRFVFKLCFSFGVVMIGG